MYPAKMPDADARRTLDEFDMIDEASTANSRDPSLEEAMQRLRERAVAEPGTEQQTKTRRFGIHLSWLHTPGQEPQDRLRILREYVRPHSEDLIAVYQYLPADLEIASTEVQQTPKVPMLHQTVVDLCLRPKSRTSLLGACSQCGRQRTPRYPLVGDAQLCALCATTPPRTQP